MKKTPALCSWLALCLLAAPASAQTAAEPVPDGLLGRWAGALIEQGTPALFELDFSLDADGSLRTMLTLPYNAYDRFPYDFAYTAGGDYDGTLTSGLFGDEMRLVVDLAEGHLRGTITEDDSVTARVHLQKVVSFDLPGIRSEEIRYRAGRDTIAGAIYFPEDAARPPVAVLVPGRGYGSRGNTAAWGKLLARSGIAALAFDGRGTGGSTGDNDAVTTTER